MALKFNPLSIEGFDIDNNSGGGGGTKYNQTFNATSDWGSPSGGFYTITILESTHSVGTSPSVEIFESDSGDFVLVNVDEVRVNASGDVSFRVPETPDLRFAGKVIII